MAHNGMPFKKRHCAAVNQQLAHNQGKLPFGNKEKDHMKEQNQTKCERPDQINQDSNLSFMQRMGQIFSALWNPNLPHFNVPGFNYQHLLRLQSVANLFPYPQYPRAVNSADSDGSQGNNPNKLCRSAPKPTTLPLDTNGLPIVRQPRQKNESFLDLPSHASSDLKSLVMPNMNHYVFPHNPLGQQPQANWQSQTSKPIIQTSAPSALIQNKNTMELKLVKPQTYSRPQHPNPFYQPSAPSATIQYGNQPPTTITTIPGMENNWELECLGVKVQLKNRNIWSYFDKLTIEMIINKDGRCLFPVLNYKLSGLDHHRFYSVFVDFILTSSHFWRYEHQTWSPRGGLSDDESPLLSSQIYPHPDSLKNGEFWNNMGANFKRLKLSNHIHAKHKKIITLSTMQRFLPRLNILEFHNKDVSIANCWRTFVFPRTSFVTVTIYQNPEISDLKIQLNPFAKSFRGGPLRLSTASPKSKKRSLTNKNAQVDLDQGEKENPAWTAGGAIKRKKLEKDADSSKAVLVDHRLMNVDRCDPWYPVGPCPKAAFNPNNLQMLDATSRRSAIDSYCSFPQRFSCNQ
ncbi:uncharacterized protein LOC143452229 isoform X2 [Clavelina lepadiformis]|uniref:T-box domain-containing protein n=1 Tax=Clavelina lepadiformis TaxID=159417 RepID=A0ABP0GW26_CLALP